MNGRVLRWLFSLAHQPRPGGPACLTIVRHHRVYANGERPLYRLGVSEQVLEQQLAMLARAGLAPLTVTQALARLAQDGGRVVAMTFDDGYADNVERALPLLERHGARATFYLTAGLMEERRAPWWDVLAHALETGHSAGAALTSSERTRRLRDAIGRLRLPPAAQQAQLATLRGELGVTAEAPCELATWALAARLGERGMEIGAHTLHHPFLSLLSVADQRAQIEGSRLLIARRLGVTAQGLAYPGGDHNADTIRICKEVGLAHAVTTRAGDVEPGDAPYTLRRRGLSEGACLGPDGRFSTRLARAELDGAFDRLRGTNEVAA